MEESKKVIYTGIGFILLVALAASLYYLLVIKRAKISPEPQELIQTMPLEIQIEKGSEEKEPDVEPIQVEWDKSDDLVRKLAETLSSHPEFSRWLLSRDLVLKFTAAVDNIAEGQSPRKHMSFFNPREEFGVITRRGRDYMDPAGFKRYSAVADVFSSLNVEQSVVLYRRLYNVIQEAYRDLGYPEGNFQNTLIRAMDELLEVPVIESDIALEKKIISYAIADPELERLSVAQKHLLRMGPRNVRTIQAKLREFRAAFLRQ